jgi:chemotaxis protein methyltransferase CheR
MSFDPNNPAAPASGVGDSGLQMSPEEFRMFRDFIGAQCGIYFGDSSKFILEKRVARLLRAHRLSTFRDYYLYLRYDRRRDEELTTLIDAVTTNETYFFREERQLKAFTEEILPELHARKREQGERTLHIWSAGCSSGEEPYTLAMLIVESKLFRDFRVDIFASDINLRMLHSARKGIYGSSSFRVTERKYIDRYFGERDGNQRINDDVRKFVSFSHLNLIDRSKISLLCSMDVICCRNVIIYFDPPTKKKVIQSLGEKLTPGGYLLLGHAESLINISNAFELRHLKNDLVYQKPGKPGA